MKHLGDITKLSGYDIPIVDVITGGSPCQDLSVAGKRAGLEGERSGLFMEQVRIVKEMREHDRRENRRTGDMVRPRYMVWENVPGALSSADGEDFRCVLEELAKVADSTASIPRPSDSWSNAGVIMGDRWSIAWRVHDAQFWGVPQRRRRVALVADFGGESAPEVLFERKGLQGDIVQDGQAREETSGGTPSSLASASYTLKVRGGVERDSKGKRAGKGALIQTEKSGTLGVSQDQTLITYGISPYGSNAMKSSNPKSGIYKADTSRTLDLNGGSPACNQGGIMVVSTIGHDIRSSGMRTDGIVDPLTATDYKDPIKVAYQDTTGTLAPGAHAGSYNGQDAYNDMLVASPIVRRLTPLECERLQGFPDGWTDIGEWTDSKGKKHKATDSPRYKAIGNSIALPFWKWLMGRISAQYERTATLGSLFDGIGGFPYCWEKFNGIGSALWASEIEEFPIAVTKIRFPEALNENIEVSVRERVQQGSDTTD